MDRELALAFWHWLFLAQPYDLPERMIGANPDAYYFRKPRDFLDADALADYRRCVRDPATIHAMCEDYRAGATIDRELDEQDRGRRRIECAVLALWSVKERHERWYDVLAVWREWADTVQGRALDCGHFLAEEAPNETATALRAFFAD